MAEANGGTRGMRGAALRAAIGAERAGAQPKDLLSSVSRALEVLEVVASSPQPLPAKAVAQRLGLSLGTSYHVLHTLEHAGYVVRLGQGRFGLGGKVAALYRLFHDQFDLVPAVRPLLDELAGRAREDAYLAVYRDGEVAVAEVIEGSCALHVEGLEVGFSRVAHTTAIGKVLLAAAPREDVDGYLEERRLAAFTRKTLIERRHIKRHLGAVQELGMGKDLEELAEGCCCVAVPVVDASGETVAAIGLSTPTERWRRERGALEGLCAEVGSRASVALGAARADG